MASIQEVFDALKDMDEKNDKAHTRITQEMRAISEREVKTETLVDEQCKRCDRRGRLLSALGVGTAIAAIGAVIGVMLG